MNTNILRFAAIVLLLAVALGAFAAHGLQSLLEAKQIKTFETGVRYQFYHGFGLFIVGLLLHWYKSKYLEWAAWAFGLGVLLFSGSLYVLACRYVLGIEHWTWIGPITPIGGLFFIIAWLFVFIGIGKDHKI